MTTTSRERVAAARAAAKATTQTRGYVHADLDDFMRSTLTLVWRRHGAVSRVRWCSRWRDHPEVVMPLKALWLAWEELASDAGVGPARWVEYLDRTMTVLTAQDGPLARCSEQECHRPAPLQLDPAPAGVDPATGEMRAADVNT